MQSWVVVLILSVSAPFCAGLTVASYNVENYNLCDRLVEGVYRKNYPKPEPEKAALRKVIGQLDADVLALQEIGGERFLAELQRDLRGEGVDYPYAVAMNAGDEDRQLAVLSKVPFKQVIRHEALPFKYFGEQERVKRGLLEVRVADGRGELALFVVHLKSRYTERADDPNAALQRAGEATAVRDRVLTQFPDPSQSTFVIVGDFNDNRSARPVQAMLSRGKTPISLFLPISDSRGHVWTHFFRKEDSYSSLDHVLVSPALMPRVRGGRIHDSSEVGQASDHRPVIAVID